MLKRLFDKSKCVLGYHAEAWQYAAVSDCRQVSVCTRCGSTTERVVHAWQAWCRPGADACRLTRACLRCGLEEDRIDHDWGDPHYTVDGSCERVRACSRCAETTSADTVHSWNSWLYDADEQCQQRIACARCSLQGSARRVQHDWGDWIHSDFYECRLRVCRRCGEMVFDAGSGEAEHEPVSLQQADAAIMHVVGSSSVEEVRQRITAKQNVLFSPAARYAFRFAADQRAADESSRKTFADLESLIARCRSEGVAAVFAPAVASPPAPPRSPSPVPEQDARPVTPLDGGILGHWRHTEAMSSGGFSLVTDTYLVLNATGAFAWWSKSRSAAGGTDSPQQDGRWVVTGRALQLRFDDGSTLVREYAAEGDSMLWPHDSRYRLWQRLR